MIDVTVNDLGLQADTIEQCCKAVAFFHVNDGARFDRIQWAECRAVSERTPSASRRTGA
jgi:hypothetical protein